VTTSEIQQSTGAIQEQQALDFFAAWGRSFDECCKSFEDLFTENTRWDQRPVPVLTGPRQAIRFLKFARVTMGLDTIEVEIRRIVSNRDVVLVERVDRLRRRDGSLIVAAPVVGVLTFSGGELTHWREYFDSAEFVARSLINMAGHGAGRLVRKLRR
jgi:limonene-1,2-epoxide hydrolase